MDRYIFDVEIYVNFFSVIFQNLESKLDTQTFVIWKDKNEGNKLLHFLNQEPITLVGFNNINFDNCILNAICNGLTLKETWDISQQIVNGKEDRNISQLRWQNVPYKSVDLMRIMAFDTLGSSLKQIGVKLRWHRIEELPIPFDSLIETQEQVDKLLDYNMNDVMITSLLYRKAIEEVELREHISKDYEVDVINASRSKVGNVLLEKLYSRRTGLAKEQFINGGTERKQVNLADCIGKNIEFETPTFQNLLEQIKSSVVTKEASFKLGKMTVSFDGNTYNIGVGGLHSQDNPGIFKQDIYDADVTSFYPNIILINRIKPQHLGNEFLDIYKEITNDRIRAKSNGERIKAEALKITINSVFGKLRHEHYWLYDPLAFFSVTISGQLYLLMLIEMLGENNIQVISANTDGVTAIVPKNKIEIYDNVCEQWMNKTSFTLDFTKYNLLVRNDVNNYLAVKENGKLKMKGLFDKDSDSNFLITSFPRAPIIAKALYNYYVNNIPIAEYINGCNDIYEFFMSQRTQKKFSLWYEDLNGKKELQRTTRFYASQKGGDLYKSNGSQRISLCADNPVLPLNDVPQNVEDFYIDKQYYIREVQKIIDNIEPPVRNNSLF